MKIERGFENLSFYISTLTYKLYYYSFAITLFVPFDLIAII